MQPTRCSGKEWARLVRKTSKRGKAEERGDEVEDKYKNDDGAADEQKLVLAQVLSPVLNIKSSPHNSPLLKGNVKM